MYRIGQEEITELSKVIFARDLFKVNKGLKESEQVETKLKKIFETQEKVVAQEQEQIKAEIIEETATDKVVEQPVNLAKKSFVKARKYATMDNSTKALAEFNQALNVLV